MAEDNIDFNDLRKRAVSQPLVSDKFTADPSAHVFDGKIYIYPSHDIDAGIPFNDNGDHFGMRDYHAYSMESPEDKEAVDLGKILDIDDVVWAKRQMWAPDIARKGDKYFFYFPAKDKDDIFRIGVAVGESPSGPFIPEAGPIKGSYSIDPAVFNDKGKYYMYFGGLWGGQLQKYRKNIYSTENDLRDDGDVAFGPLVAEMSGDMLSFSNTPKEIIIQDENGKPLLAGDNNRRYFEGPWMHKYNEKYYLSYSTGDTHFICYATGDDPTGPFKYKGKILAPVVGWTTHHSIFEFEGRWFLFYHDSSLSNGVTHLRCMKVIEIFYDEMGNIKTVYPYKDKNYIN
tara:strand:- start:6294 stop:7319 length:1026 start_codon:yes stop_codon:yes gene_type:complete